MAGERLLLLGIAAAIVLIALVAGSAYIVLRDSFKQLRETRDHGPARRPAVVRTRPRDRDGGARRGLERTGLRWYSPEIVAVLLLALAAGLWLARLSGAFS